MHDDCVTKGMLTRLDNSISFKQWCVENNRYDLLDRWDYELNSKLPDKISFKTNTKYWFACPYHKHNKELKSIYNITSFASLGKCNGCDSFAQWGIDNVCDDFLEKYWDYDENTLDPWKIFKCNSKIKVWIKCQEKEYHENYQITCADFHNGCRCPYCSNHHGKVHKSDSLGSLHSDVYKYWSERNKKSPYEFAPMSSQKVWWKCHNSEHEDYIRDIKHSVFSNFLCPSCQDSYGEKTIETYFVLNEIKFKKHISFSDLVGTRNGYLSYDFYLPDYGLLIEFRGKQHCEFIKGMHKTMKDFERQIEHDSRKKEYANDNNIELLEIYYWDLNNINNILHNKLYKGGQ
jgi:hypothetical protein